MVVGRRGTGQRDGARSKGFNRLKCVWGGQREKRLPDTVRHKEL